MNSESRTTLAKRNILFGYISKLTTMVLEFISRAVFIKILGEEYLGIGGVFTNIIQVLALAELGMNNVLGYSFYKPIAENNESKIAALISFYKKIYNCIAIAVAIIGLILIPFLHYLINTSIYYDNLTEIYLLYLIDTVISYLFVYKSTLLRSAQRSYIANRYEIVCTIVRTTLQICSILAFGNFLIYLAIKVVMSGVTNYLIAHRAEKEYPYIKQIKQASLDNESKKDIVKTIRSGFVYKLSAVLLNSTDNVFISIIVSTVAVGYLSNYLTIIQGLSSFYTILFASLTAGVGNLVVTTQRQHRREIFEQLLFVSSWIAIVFSVCLYVLADDFVILWLGRKYVIDQSVLLSKVLMLFISCSLQPIFSYREALGLYNKTKYAMLLAAIVNIGLSVIMGIYWGMAGILFASIIAVLGTYFWYEPIVLYKDCFDIDASKYFKNKLVDLLFLIVALFGFRMVCTYIVVNTWIMWVLKALIVFWSVNLYCYILFGSRKEFHMLRNKMK